MRIPALWDPESLSQTPGRWGVSWARALRSPPWARGPELWNPFVTLVVIREEGGLGRGVASHPAGEQARAPGLPSQLCSGELERTLAAACDSARGPRTATGGGGGVLRGGQGDAPGSPALGADSGHDSGEISFGILLSETGKKEVVKKKIKAAPRTPISLETFVSSEVVPV